MRKHMLKILALLLAVPALALTLVRTDLGEWHSTNLAKQLRLTKDAVFVQTGTSADTNALGPTAITGAFSASGTGSFGDALTLNGEKISVPATYTVGATTTVTPTSEFGLLFSTGNAVTWAGSPSIATTSATNGQFFELMAGSTQAITFTDSTTLQLSTSGVSTNRIFSSIGDNIGLRYYNSVWYEVYFSTGHQ